MNKKTTILCITGLLMLFFPGCGHHYVEPIHTSVIYDTRPYVKKVHVYGPRYHRTHRLRYHKHHHTYFGHRRIYTPKRKYYKRYRRYYKNHNRKGHGYKSKRQRANKRKYKQPSRRVIIKRNAKKRRVINRYYRNRTKPKTRGKRKHKRKAYKRRR